MYVTNGHIRADGTMLHDMHLLRVKTPALSSGPWDVYDLIATVPGAKAFPMVGEPAMRLAEYQPRPCAAGI